jgi:hypothetical protein
MRDSAQGPKRISPVRVVLLQAGAFLLTIVGVFAFSRVPLLGGRLPTGSHIHPRDGQFPVIYVGKGLVDCGSPLVKDQCSAFPLITTVSTGNKAFMIHATSLLSINATGDLFKNNPIIAIPIDGSLTLSGTYQLTITPSPASTRILIQTSYSASIVSPSTLEVPTKISPRLDVSSPTTDPKKLPRGLQRVRRSYDYNSCDDDPPNHDLVSTSLTDVCHFVANAKQYFVSLRPSTNAAYMPSWTGYLIQIILTIINLRGIVSDLSMNGLIARI